MVKLYAFFYFSRILNNLGQDFQNLAEMCLLVLHLEIRCHCFYFLLQALRQVLSVLLW
jgi:exocyst complex component 4